MEDYDLTKSDTVFGTKEDNEARGGQDVYDAQADLGAETNRPDTRSEAAPETKGIFQRGGEKREAIGRKIGPALEIIKSLGRKGVDLTLGTADTLYKEGVAGVEKAVAASYEERRKRFGFDMNKIFGRAKNRIGVLASEAQLAGYSRIYDYAGRRIEAINDKELARFYGITDDNKAGLKEMFNVSGSARDLAGLLRRPNNEVQNMRKVQAGINLVAPA